MTDIEAFLANLGARGIEVTLDGDDLMVGPGERLTADDRATLRACKPEIRVHVRSRGAENAAPAELSNDSATHGQNVPPGRLPKPIVDAVPLETPPIATATTGDRETKPATKPRRKRKRGVGVTRDGMAICRWCDATGEIPHHLTTAFWLFWTSDCFATVLEQMRPNERVAWLAHRCVCLVAADNTERILYERNGLWSAEPDLDAIVDGGVAVIAGALPDVLHSRGKDKGGDNGSGKRDFLVSLTGAIACRRCGEPGRHDLTLLFTAFWRHEQLAALVQAMQPDEHLDWIKHQLVKLQAADGSERTLYESGGSWRDESDVPTPDPNTKAARSQSDRTPQYFETLIAAVLDRCAYWCEHASPQVRLRLDTLIREAKPAIAEHRAQQNIDALRDCLIDLQRRIGDALERPEPPTAPSDPVPTLTAAVPLHRVAPAPNRDQHGNLIGAPLSHQPQVVARRNKP
jgi:hypothetical protein